MMRSPFQVVGDSLSGRGLTFNVTLLIGPTPKEDDSFTHAARMEQLTEIAEIAYREGRSSTILSWDDRFDLHGAIDVLRSLAVIVGPNPTGDRHRRMADILARLLQAQEIGE
jgi:hypothetical protein